MTCNLNCRVENHQLCLIACLLIDALYTVRAVTEAARMLTCYHQPWQISWLWRGPLLWQSRSSLGHELGFAFPGQGEEVTGPPLPHAWGERLWWDPPLALRFCLRANTKGRVETKQAKPSFSIFSQSLTIFNSDFHRSLSIFVFSNPPWISSPCLFPLKSIKTFILQPKETCSMQ